MTNESGGLDLHTIHPETIMHPNENTETHMRLFLTQNIQPHPVPEDTFFSVSDYSDCLRNQTACILHIKVL